MRFFCGEILAEPPADFLTDFLADLLTDFLEELLAETTAEKRATAVVWENWCASGWLQSRQMGRTNAAFISAIFCFTALNGATV